MVDITGGKDDLKYIKESTFGNQLTLSRSYKGDYP